MTSSFHNMNGSLFACFRWPKSSLLRDMKCESSEGGIRIVAMHSTAGIGTAVILCDRPSVVTTTRPQATIGLRKNSVTSLNSQGRASEV
jgi:hypothetical protein